MTVLLAGSVHLETLGGEVHGLPGGVCRETYTSGKTL